MEDVVLLEIYLVKCISNKIDANLKIFNTIKGANESKASIKHTSYERKSEFDGRKCNTKQKWNNDICQL